MNIVNQSYALEPVASLTPHPRNPNRGALERIQESIAANGFYGAIIAQSSTRFILAGEHRWKAATEAKATVIPTIWVDCGEKEAIKIMLADNRLTRLGMDDPEVLASLLRELETQGDLSGTGFSDDDYLALLEEASKGPPAEPEPLENPLEELRVKWDTQQGQLWIIPSASSPGREHRILCGDSTDPQNLERLLGKTKPAMIYADPPYGISIVRSDGKIGNGKTYKPVFGDNDTRVAEDAATLLLQRHPKAVHVWWGGNYYSHALHPSSCWLVWDKNNGDTTFADAELAWTNQPSAVRIFKHTWSGFNTESENAADRIHPTQKPVALAAWVFDRYGQRGDTVLDPFLGSGSSLIAAEQTRRTLSGIEFDPEYIAGILERCTQLGLEPQLAPETRPT
jgi:DNA methylase/ParB-like nuclease domain